MDRAQAGDTFVRMLHAIDATQHITGPILVQRTAAGVIARAHVRAITLTVFYQEGNLNLPSMARARATPPGPIA
jgi:hypothetical protein